MLMDDRLVALNEVLSHCRELAELYRGDRMGVDSDTQALFERSGEAHDRFADHLSGQIRALGELPAEEDPERLGVERLATDLKSFFSGQRDTSLADTFEQTEAKLDQAITTALGHDLPDAIRQALQQHRSVVTQHRQALSGLA